MFALWCVPTVCMCSDFKATWCDTFVHSCLPISSQAGKKKCSPASTSEPNSGSLQGYGFPLGTGYDATSAVPPSLSFWSGNAPPPGSMDLPQGFSNMPFNQFEFMASMEPNPEGGEPKGPDRTSKFVSAFAQHSAQMGREPHDGGSARQMPQGRQSSCTQTDAKRLIMLCKPHRHILNG